MIFFEDTGRHMSDANIRTAELASPSQAPLYRRIYLELRHRIMSGEYPDRSFLPSEFETAREFNVSRITAKRALNEVAADGLCVRRRGQGSRVTFKPSSGPLRSDAQGLLDIFSDLNLETEGFVLEFDYRPASTSIARTMRLAEGDEVQRSVRTRHFDGRPLSYLTTYVPAELGRLYSRDNLIRQAPLTLLEKSGINVAGADQTMTAELADAAKARGLDVSLGAPLLRISRKVFDLESRVVEYIVGHYRPDQYQYHMSLNRVSDGERISWSAAG